MYATVQKPFLCSILAIYFVVEHVHGNHIQSGSLRGATSHSSVRRANPDDRITKSKPYDLTFPGEYIDAFDYSKCGRSRLKPWQQRESAFSCKDEPSIRYGNQRASNYSERISIGETANYGEFPSAVKLVVYFKSGQKGLCGGTLIHKNLVITAAHCLKDAEDIIVYYGGNTHRTQSYMRTDAHCLHKDFGYDEIGTTRNDLSMIRLREEVDYVKDELEPACLQLRTHHHLKAVCALAGFGFINDETTTDKLKTISLVPMDCGPVANGPEQACWNRPNPSDIGGSCPGDSGSGIYCFDSCHGEGQRSFVVGTHAGARESVAGRKCSPHRRVYQRAADHGGLSIAIREMIGILLHNVGVDKHECFWWPLAG